MYKARRASNQQTLERPEGTPTRIQEPAAAAQPSLDLSAAPPHARISDFRPQNREGIRFCRFKPPACANLLRELQETRPDPVL